MKARFAGFLLTCLASVMPARLATADAKIAAAARDGDRTAAIALVRRGSEDPNAKLPDGTSACVCRLQLASSQKGQIGHLIVEFLRGKL